MRGERARLRRSWSPPSGTVGVGRGQEKWSGGRRSGVDWRLRSPPQGSFGPPQSQVGSFVPNGGVMKTVVRPSPVIVVGILLSWSSCGLQEHPHHAAIGVPPGSGGSSETGGSPGTGGGPDTGGESGGPSTGGAPGEPAPDA